MSKKYSGAQNRKRKAKDEKDAAIQKDSLLQFLKKKNENEDEDEIDGNGGTTSQTTMPKSITSAYDDGTVASMGENMATHYEDYADVEVKSETVLSQSPTETAVRQVGETSLHDEQVGASSIFDFPDENQPVVNLEDPALWPKNSDANRIILITKGPVQAKLNLFPETMNRRFSAKHYVRKLDNGEELPRTWLVYSTSTDSVFCFCCKLFYQSSFSFALATNGCNDWKNLSKTLLLHEKSPHHMDTYLQWKEMEARFRESQCIDRINQRLILQEVQHWRDVLERLIGLIRTHAAQNLALRGTSDKLFDTNNGNFLKFVEYISTFDPVMKDHLRRIQTESSDSIKYVHYLGKNIQNELINLLGTHVQNIILGDAKKAKYFSIILDSTPDAGHVEQMSLVIRFVTALEKDENHQGRVDVREHFLDFIPLQDTTGAGMADILSTTLDKHGLLLSNIRGQGYDNGANMSGKNNGVQRKILDINPRAFYVPCNAHTLNLVVNDAAKCCIDAVNFFGIVQSIYVFFAGSTHRWDVLLKHVSSLTVKPLSETRWEARVDALRVLRYELGPVYDALVSLSEDKNLKGVTGTKTRADAQAIAAKLLDFKFLVAVVIWYKVLYEVNVTSKMLQGVALDLSEAVKQLKKTEICFSRWRSDEGFLEAITDAKELANEIDLEDTNFPATKEIRVRKKKLLFNYESPDEPVINPQENFKINFFFAVLDTAIQSVAERFNQLDDHNSNFGFVYNINSVSKEPQKTLLEKCQNLERILTHGDSKDIDALQLCDELICIVHRTEGEEINSPYKLLQYICKSEMCEIFPNLTVVLRIILTLPLTVASGERSFSKLKLIKNYLRTTMTQNRLVNLSILSIEKDIAADIDLTLVVREFAEAKARRVKF